MSASADDSKLVPLGSAAERPAVAGPTQPTPLASTEAAIEVRLVSGTPITGSSVWAATTPGSAADRPAPAMITRIPRSCAFLA